MLHGSSTTMKITSEMLKQEAVAINILLFLISVIINFVILIGAPILFRRINLMWRWYRVKKAGGNLQKFMDDFFSNLPPRESELCKDCKHSEFSNNNGNLPCLHERSRHFGEAVPPDADRMGFCYFERAGNTNNVSCNPN